MEDVKPHRFVKLWPWSQGLGCEKQCMIVAMHLGHIVMFVPTLSRSEQGTQP